MADVAVPVTLLATPTVDGAPSAAQVVVFSAPSEEPALIDEPDSTEENDDDDDDDDDDDSDGDEDKCGLEMYGALHGLEPLAPGAEPRQRIGTSKCGISKKSWTKAEDHILTEIVTRNGAQRWSSVAAQLPGRAGKQCRERCAHTLSHSPRRIVSTAQASSCSPRARLALRLSLVSPRSWFNHLCPEVKKGAWTAEEDRVIMESVARYGTRWSKIVKLMPGRTDNAIKNRYNSAMRRQKRLDKLKNGGESPPKPQRVVLQPANAIMLASTAAAIAVALPAGTLTTTAVAVPTEVLAVALPLPKPVKRKREDAAEGAAPEPVVLSVSGAGSAGSESMPPVAPSVLAPASVASADIVGTARSMEVDVPTAAPTLVTPASAQPSATALSKEAKAAEREVKAAEKAAKAAAKEAAAAAKAAAKEAKAAKDATEMPPPISKPVKSPRKSPKKPSAKNAFFNFPSQFDENLRMAGFSPPNGVSPPALAALLASHVPVGDDPTFSALQELLLNHVSPPPPHAQQPPTEDISPSSQIMMLLEENGITGPVVAKEEAATVGASPFDFSGAYFSGASSGHPSAGGAMGPPPPMPHGGGKAKAKAEAARWAEGGAPAAAMAAMEAGLEIPNQRRESGEGEEKRLSAGTILDFYTLADPTDERRLSIGSIGPMGKTPPAASMPAPVQVGESGKADGTSPTVGEMSPLGAFCDVLTAF